MAHTALAFWLQRRPLRRAVASLVLLTFLGPLVFPPAPAAQTLAPRVTPASSPAASHETELVETLTHLEAKLERLHTKLTRAEAHHREVADLRTLQTRLGRLDTQARQAFTQRAQQLQTQGMPAAIQQRHQAMVTAYTTQMTTLRRHLDTLTAARTPAARTTRAAQALQHLQQTQPPRPQSRLAPAQRPFRVPEGKVRPPKTTKEEFESALTVPQPVLVAAAAEVLPGLLAAPAVTLPALPTPEDLAATEDVQLTEEMQALVASLERHPVQIVNWVHDTIAFVPTYGSLQGAHLTLQAKRGNAWDTASLLIALLRTAHIPARYVLGTVQLPIVQVQQWLGGVATPEAALALLGQGGIPSAAVVQGGTITAVHLEHVWVEAWVDFAPSRGTVPRQGDAWIPLDASVKQSAPLTGPAPLSLGHPAIQSAATALVASAQVRAEGPALTGLDLSPLAPLAQGLHQPLRTAYPPETRLDAVLGPRPIVPSPRTVLAAGLPYTVVVRGRTQTTLTPAQRHHVHLALFATPLDQAAGRPALTYTRSLPALQTQRLGVTYAPATAADTALLERLREDGSQTLPVYLLRVQPQIQLDGVTVATGPEMPMGQALTWDVTLQAPDEPVSAPVTWPSRAGDAQVFSLQGHRVTPALVQERLARPGLPTAAEDLHLAALQYGLLTATLAAHTATLHGAQVVPLPMVTLAGQPLSVTLLLGLPLSGTYQQRALDLPQARWAVVAPDDATRRAVLRQLGGQASSAAGAVLDSLFGRPQGTSRTAVQGLATATQQRLPIAVLTAANVATLLPQLPVRPVVAAELREAAAAGLLALVPVPPAAPGPAPALGVVVLDPLTGASTALLDDGVHGSVQVDCRPHGQPDPAGVLSPALVTRLAALASPTALVEETALTWLTASVAAAGLATALPAAPGAVPGPLVEAIALVTGHQLMQDALVALAVVAPATAPDCLADTTPPTVHLSGVPTSTAAGYPVTFTLTATDERRVVRLTLLVNDVPQALDPTGQVTYTPSTPGLYTVVVLVEDSAGNRVRRAWTFVAVDPTQDTTPPVVALTAPALDAPVTAPTAVQGTVQDATLVRWTLDLAPRGEATFTPIATGTTAVTDGVLGTFDPTLLVNDLYELRLRAEDANGRTASTTLAVQVTGQMKIGYLSFTIQDLTIPAAGLPIAIDRVYDSRNTTSGDFGVGWHLDVQSVKVRENRLLGTGWQQGRINTFTYCVQPTSAHYVTITLPNGRTDTFDMTLEPACQTLFPVRETTVTFTPRPGTFSRLEAVVEPLVLVVGSLDSGVGNFAPVELLQLEGDGGYYDPTIYRLTTLEGVIFNLDQTFGVRRITEPNGHTLTFGAGGIVHSAGPSVVFTRDVQGRITQITDPMGHTLQYAYDAAGDLVAVADQEGHTTRHTYDATHKLVAIKDPRGVTIVQTLYDEAGRVVAHIDAEGHRIDYIHDIVGRQETIRNRLGQTTLLAYDDAGNIVRRTDPLGHTTTSAYDAQGNLLSETDALGQTTGWTYDAGGRRLTMTDAEGQTTRWTYDVFGRVLSIIDPQGYALMSLYDAAGNIIAGTDPQGHTTHLAYNAQGHLRTRTDALGQRTSYVTDAGGRVTALTNPLGQTTTYTFSANGDMLTRSNPVGQTTQYTYDALGHLTQLVAAGEVKRLAYDATGRLTHIIGATGSEARLAYDATGRLVARTLPDGTLRRQTFDAEGNLTGDIDPFGQATQYVYDSAQRRIRTIYLDGATLQHVYDRTGRLVENVGPRGDTTRFIYDAVGRRIRTTDAFGGATLRAYDPSGHLIALTDPLGQVTRFEYAAFALDTSRNRITRTQFPDGTTTQAVYDAVANQIEAIDPAGARTQFHYDALGRLTAVSDAMGHTTRYEYNSQGYRTAQIDANGHTTAFTYDERGRLLQVTYPLGQIVSWSYDADGRILTLSHGNDEVILFHYDAGGRLMELLLPDGTREGYTYTLDGLIDTVTDVRGTTRYSYDIMRRTISTKEPDGRYVRYAYDLAGNRVQTASAMSPGAPERVMQYSYDLMNRLTAVVDDEGGVTHYTYDAAGNVLTLTRPNGTVTRYTYDPLYRPTSITHQQADGTILARFQLLLDARGHRTTVISADHARVEYRYDALSRLVAERHIAASGSLSGEVTYTYDAVGNLIRRRGFLGDVDYTYNANNQLVAANAMAFTYDAAGRLVATTDGTAVNRYSYDARGRLVRWEPPSGAPTIYTYDAFGLRQRIEGPSGTVHFLVDRYNATGFPQVIAMTDATGTLLQSYRYGHSLLARTDHGTVAYYHMDGLGSTRLLTDATGFPTDTYTYSAYGELLSHTGVSTNPFLFAGEERDSAAGWYYLRARYYDPTTGRFLSRDPRPGNLSLPVTQHAYLYARGNPVNLVDPSGEAGIGLNISRFLHRLFRGSINSDDRSFRPGVSLARAVEMAELMAATALIDVDDDPAKYRKFFGKGGLVVADLVGHTLSFDDGRSYVAGGYAAILQALRDGPRFISGDNPGAYAQTTLCAYDRTITINPPFWTLPLLARDSKAGTLIHELSHNVYCTTHDPRGLTYADVLELARSAPHRAIQNSYSYEYFATEDW